MNTLLHTPEKTKVSKLIHVDGTLLSLSYIRTRALGCLGEPFTEIVHHSQHTKSCHTIISGVFFEKGNGSWQSGSPSNSDTHNEALEEYFFRLKTARKVRKGNDFFQWDKEAMMFVEVK